MEPKPKLVELVRQSVRIAHYSYQTQQQHVFRSRRFRRCHGKRHPAEMDEAEMVAAAGEGDSVGYKENRRLAGKHWRGGPAGWAARAAAPAA